MTTIARRSALGLLGLGAAAGVTSVVAAAGPAVGSRALARALPVPHRPDESLIANRVVAENALPGTGGLLPSTPGLLVTDRARQIQGYADRSSVGAGEEIRFHVSVHGAQRYTIEVLRLGHYGGLGTRAVLATRELPGRPYPIPAPRPGTGTIHCSWPEAWRMRIPPEWTSGTYVARFRTAGGSVAFTPFVVRDPARPADFCVVLPTATWQAYNQWPRDLVHGRSLYYGYDRRGQIHSDLRAYKVSFDRPYHESGLPVRFDAQRHTISFLERQGFDLTYAASEDLHSGTLDPRLYRGLLFIGHDEYWSAAMRRRATAALDGGVSLVYLAANNVYWHVRFEPGPDSRPDRVLTCYKHAPDPEPGDGPATHRWRTRGGRDPGQPEQELLGVMYNGIVRRPAPLVAAAAEHWAWAGTGVRDGDAIPHVVGGEADGYVDLGHLAPPVGEHTLLSHSPYRDRGGRVRVQNTSLRELPHGPLVFTAGSLIWPDALGDRRLRDRRVLRLTANVLRRVRAGEGAAATAGAAEAATR